MRNRAGLGEWHSILAASAVFVSFGVIGASCATSGLAGEWGASYGPSKIRWISQANNQHYCNTADSAAKMPCSSAFLAPGGCPGLP